MAMVTLSESQAWYAPHGQDNVAEPPFFRATHRSEEEDEYAVEVFSPRSGRARALPASTTPAPPVKTQPPTVAPPPRPSYDKPAPPRRVVNHLYDYPEFVATPNPTTPIGQSYFGVDLGSLSDPEESGSDHVTTAPPPTDDPTPESASVPAIEDSPVPETTDKIARSSPADAAFFLQLIKVLLWPVVALILIAVLGGCLLSGCSVGLFGRQCFKTNAHRQALVSQKT